MAGCGASLTSCAPTVAVTTTVPRRPPAPTAIPCITPPRRVTLLDAGTGGHCRSMQGRRDVVSSCSGPSYFLGQWFLWGSRSCGRVPRAARGAPLDGDGMTLWSSFARCEVGTRRRTRGRTGDGVVRTNLESCGRLPLFFVLAFAITWSVWISATTYTHGRRRSLADEANLYHLMSLVRGELDPRLAAVLLLALFSCGPGRSAHHGTVPRRSRFDRPRVSSRRGRW